MRTILLTIVLPALLVGLHTPIAQAQYYGNHYPYQSAPAPVAKKYPTPGSTPSLPFQYRLAPKPGLYWKWDQYNRFSEYQNYLRSPLNPESDLDYLMRTF